MAHLPDHTHYLVSQFTSCHILVRFIQYNEFIHMLSILRTDARKDGKHDHKKTESPILLDQFIAKIYNDQTTRF